MAVSPIAHSVTSSGGPPQRLDTAGSSARRGFWGPGVRLFCNLQFPAKAIIVALLFATPSFALIAWLLVGTFQEARQARMDATRQHVEVAMGVLAWAQSQEAAGKLTREQAQQLARAETGAMRYGKNDYFWIVDMQPRMVMHPINPDLNGRSVSEFKDPNTVDVFNRVVDLVRKEARGFIPYKWPKPGSSEPLDKIAYVEKFEPWGWVLGSGIYVGDLREGLGYRLAWIATIMLAGSALAAYLFVSFYLVMEGGLKRARLHMRAIASGDLTKTPEPIGSDELADLLLDLRDMQRGLLDIVARMRQSSDEIVRTGDEIACEAIELSTRTEQTTASLRGSASSMDEITATAMTSSDRIEEASQVARRNAELAGDGGRAMHAVVETMDGIHRASARIGEIIGTIDGIAFQTNILALNAAVEAARAGEQGRGFAVVASEVRTLAQRSAEAAQQIKTLIGSSVEQVEAGSEIVRNAGGTIEEIVMSSQRVDQLLGEVTHGAREQSQGITRIGQAVEDLDRMTQQNAAMADRAAGAASAIRDQAKSLAGEVARFRIGI